MNRTPSASPASKTGMMCGWSTAAAARDSWMNRCRNESSEASCGARILRATLRPTLTSRGTSDDRHAAAAELLLDLVARDLPAGRGREHGRADLLGHWASSVDGTRP